MRTMPGRFTLEEYQTLAYLSQHEQVLNSIVLSVIQKGLEAGGQDGGRDMKYYDLARPIVQLLDYNIGYWFSQKMPQWDNKGKQIVKTADKIWAFNQYVLKGSYLRYRAIKEGRVMQTSMHTPVLDRISPTLITGLTVFTALHTGLEESAMSDMVRLFKTIQKIPDDRIVDVKKPPSGITILFLNKTLENPILLEDVLPLLTEYNCDSLRQFIQQHIEAIKYVTNATCFKSGPRTSATT
jgi:hypothetical protein